MLSFRRLLLLALLAFSAGLSACNKEVTDPGAVAAPSTPTLIVAPAALLAFSGQVGTASAAQSFTVSGTALTGRISATAPAGFELSLSPATAYAASLELAPTTGAVTAVYVRLAAAPAPGTFSGSIGLNSHGATARTLAVTGTAAATAPPVSAAPTVTGFLPASGPVGTALTITGSNFTGATAVTLNGVPLPGFVVASASVIMASVPAGTPVGSGLVSVTTPGGTAASALTFSVVPAGPVTLRSGTMMPQGGVPSSGTASLERDAAGAESIRFAADFRTDFHTGSLGVYLAKSDALVRVQRAANPANVVRIATITHDGAQVLAVPGSAAGYSHVIIHCDPAMYNFGAALLH